MRVMLVAGWGGGAGRERSGEGGEFQPRVGGFWREVVRAGVGRSGAALVRVARFGAYESVGVVGVQALAV